MQRLVAAVALVFAACGDDGASASASTGVADSSSDAGMTTVSSGSLATTATGDASTGGEASWTIAMELGVELGMAMAVFGASADEVRVVGGQDGDAGSTGFVLRYDGAAFVPEAVAAGTPMLNWIGAAGSDLWAVGLDGATLRHEDGEWVAHDSGTDVTLWGVWGGSADEVWAVGGDGFSELPTLLRWDGAAWSDVALPELPRASHGLFKVWGADPQRVFVVGDGGVVMRRLRGEWIVDALSGVAPLISVWGRGPDDVVAVGGRANARVLRWDGADWSDATLEPMGCNGVWVDDDGAAIVVCRMGGIYELAPGSIELAPVDSPTLHLLHAVHGFTGGPRFAVGGSFEGPPPWVGVILHHPG